MSLGSCWSKYFHSEQVLQFGVLPLLCSSHGKAEDTQSFDLISPDGLGSSRLLSDVRKDGGRYPPYKKCA